MRFLCLLAALALFGSATAQEETFISRTFDASHFIETLQEEAEVYNETLTNIGRVLAALGLVSSVVVAATKWIAARHGGDPYARARGF